MARFYGMRARYLATAALLLAAALALVLEWAGGDDHEKAERPARSGERSNLEASPEATAAPGRQLELASRSLPSAGGNPFFTQAQVQPPSPPPRAATREPSAAPPAPQAPPLPFTYLGRIRSGETTTVFLARDNRESSARLGSILDDSYRVEKIDESVRSVISKNMARSVLNSLKTEPQEAGANWSRWYKVLSEKMYSGEIMQVAEVVRDLSYAQQTKGISPALKRMLSKARMALISELSFSLEVDEEEATRRLDRALPKIEAEEE